MKHPLAALIVAATVSMAAAAAAPDNPLLARWVGPYGGVPPFDKVKVAQFEPALKNAMAASLAELDRIANNQVAPSFDNTIAAMERSGKALERVSSIFNVYTSTLSTDAVQVVERTMAPLLAEYADKITQNGKLFERIAAVYATR